MELSNNNAKILLLDTHQDIEEFADTLVTNILDKKDFSFLTYPPNCGLTELEIEELKKLGNNEHLKNGLRKVIADNSAGIIFNMFNLFDGTGFPKNSDDDWTGLKLIDEEPNENSESVDDWLHDKFYETYWDWKKIRGDKIGNWIH
ncbi:hypothetical protein FAZ19_19085 [Sphingobacterium alkalisoli]|uniref:Uncharacterized protein n=1 Tax=Sphingobacterium alkalisoli TaxID=1874115 RepID=A0A4V5LXH3_9SPHI|nr:hypothetical protein [Sphingobacterium alkalisoli]TJY62579.1 hypothetical protein FAZ19_19085 [Sphingobacterium alkalisoli]GGH27571.1 hypothetical protein GCM10011418_37570 [Sphingobacterium alkalisoli]